MNEYSAGGATSKRERERERERDTQLTSKQAEAEAEASTTQTNANEREKLPSFSEVLERKKGDKASFLYFLGVFIRFRHETLLLLDKFCTRRYLSYILYNDFLYHLMSIFLFFFPMRAITL